MKKFFVILVFFLIAVSALPGSASAAALVKPPNNLGLVSYWNFNESSGTIAHDLISGNNGTLLGSPLPSWVSAKFSNGLSFNTSNYLDVGTPAALEGLQVPVTISAWFKQNSTSGGQTIYGAYSGTSGGNIWSLIRIDAGTLRYFTSNSGGSYQYSGSFTPSAGQWHFVAVTVSGSLASPTVTIRLDGQTQSSAFSALYATPNTSVDIQIGHNATGGEGINGTIDDVRVFNRALSVSETLALYQSGSTQLNASQTAIMNGLVGWWTFDGFAVSDKVYDRSGQGNNGYMYGVATSTAKVIGETGQALTFSSALPSYVSVPYSSTLAPTGQGISFGAWFKMPDKTVDGRIFSKTESGGYSLSINDTISNSLTAAVNTGSYHYVSYANSNFSNNTWYHAFVTYDGSNVKLYFNGQLVSTTAATGNVHYSYNNPFCIGAEPNSTTCTATPYFDGTIDDVRVYNRGLSASEVKQIYGEGGSKVNDSSRVLQTGSTLSSGLVGYWSFDGPDVSGTTVYDRSGQSNNGTMVNGPQKVIGKLGQALDFNGTNQSVSLGSQVNIDPNTTWSISSWIKITSNPTTGWWAIVHSNSVGGLGYGLVTGPPLRVRITKSSVVDGPYSNTFPSLNTWHHLVVTYNAGATSFYLDGAADGTGTFSSPSFSSAPDYIGKGGGSRYFDGSIDDVRVYNRVLSASEVKQLYNLGK